ncbi:T9SS type A sorting domain-containing protein [Chitinophaga sp. Mgbs1]|uniref:T9SS type A sorting domain-containing protein n=1 Tax=Chitinophaga solisilvae TaxID=1233460 RepID=A0A9Q5GV41_9BACT|nr:T9SS type A sorting domain-containing protein [Chitinophaga solisilvae]
MNKFLPLFIIGVLMHFSHVKAQNADYLYYNQALPYHHYKAAGIVIDTPASASSPKQAFLLWSANAPADSTRSTLSLDQFDANGNFLQQRVIPQTGRTLPYLLPKKIIRMRKGNGYYLLGYVIKSPNPVGGVGVYSTPVVLRLDKLLNPVWVEKLHFAAVSVNTEALIEYNDIIESELTGEIILAGRYSPKPTAITRVLVTRLKASGTILWNYVYKINTGCSANALSLTEAGDGGIVLTGYTEECNGSISGPQQTLFFHLKSGGTVVNSWMYTGNPASAGYKIIKREKDQFLITGYLDQVVPTGLTNKQIQLLDVKQDGTLNSMFLTGDKGYETGNDLILKDLGNNVYYLYFTGYTSSYYQQPATEAYFGWFKYDVGSLNLIEFNTFPAQVSYYNRTGVAIKAAGKDKFAILANGDYKSNGGPANSFSNVLVRDLQSGTGDCYKAHQPPVEPYKQAPKDLGAKEDVLDFKEYTETFKKGLKVYAEKLCGQLVIDAADALNAGIIEKAVPVNDAPQATSGHQAALVKVYPNPATSQIFVEFTRPVKEKIQIKIFGADMRLLRQQEASDHTRKSVSLDGLPAGLYFIQVGSRSHQEIFKIRKD